MPPALWRLTLFISACFMNWGTIVIVAVYLSLGFICVGIVLDTKLTLGLLIGYTVILLFWPVLVLIAIGKAIANIIKK